MSSNYAFWEMAYSLEWATIDQLRFVLAQGEITQEEFDKIVGVN